MTTRTRFAPSPTGVLHLGSVRTALFCWLYAHHCGGKYILRIEDTDRERSTPENVEAILDGMQWLGMQADEGPYFQTERFDRYSEVIDQWLEEYNTIRPHGSLGGRSPAQFIMDWADARSEEPKANQKSLI